MSNTLNQQEPSISSGLGLPITLAGLQFAATTHTPLTIDRRAAQHKPTYALLWSDQEPLCNWTGVQLGCARRGRRFVKGAHAAAA
jgi:hypothetical protein